MAERMHLAETCGEDVFFLECTPRYPIRSLRQQLAEAQTHKLVWVKDGPELHGWPHKRMRVLAAGLSCKTVEWVGPSSDEKIAEDFTSRFHRSTTLSGDVFMMASDCELHTEYAALVANRCFRISPPEVEGIPKDELLRMILPLGGVQRFKGWRKEYESNGSLGGTLLFDADHLPGMSGSTSGSDWLVNLRHGSVFSTKRIACGSGSGAPSSTWLPWASTCTRRWPARRALALSAMS